MTVIWHNPRCSKSRETLALIEEHSPQIRLYLKAPPTEEELRAVQAKLGVPFSQMIRAKDKGFAATGLGKDSPDSAFLAAMVADPSLIERPIVITAEAAAIGRPPQSVLGLFPAKA